MNRFNSSNLLPLRLIEMNFVEVRECVDLNPSLIVPIGGVEPYGKYGALGLVSRCSDSICAALSSRLEIPLAPLINYGCTRAFKAFEGCAGLHPTTFCNIIMEICNDWIFQGFKRVLLINLSPENDDALSVACKRLNKLEDRVRFFSVQSDNRVRQYVSETGSKSEYGRSEFLMNSLGAYLYPQSFKPVRVDKSVVLPPVDQFKTWQKRGKDPQKFRKLFPSASTSEIADKFTTQLGEEFFGFILNILEEEYTPFLIVSKNAAS